MDPLTPNRKATDLNPTKENLSVGGVPMPRLEDLLTGIPNIDEALKKAYAKQLTDIQNSAKTKRAMEEAKTSGVDAMTPEAELERNQMREYKNKLTQAASGLGYNRFTFPGYGKLAQQTGTTPPYEHLTYGFGSTVNSPWPKGK
jgi:hypothetical protein